MVGGNILPRMNCSIIGSFEFFNIFISCLGSLRYWVLLLEGFLPVAFQQGG